jgi:NhaP-type Na+/H+ or K+/H+ antiporter
MICSLRLPQVRRDRLRQRLELTPADSAGTAVSWDGRFNRETEAESFASVIDLMLNCACFIYIGAWLDFKAFNSPALGITPWRLIALFLCIVTFRRIPALLTLYKWVPEINTWQEALFTGHFGKRRCL